MKGFARLGGWVLWVVEILRNLITAVDYLAQDSKVILLLLERSSLRVGSAGDREKFSLQAAWLVNHHLEII